MRLAVLSMIYGCSGATSLAFEVLWARMLSLQFGVSIFGVVVTVAAFMAGLGLGSLLALRRGIRRPLLVFALLEGGVAVYAVALPWIFKWADTVLTAAAPGISLTSWYALQAAALLVLLLAPAIAMGAAFPMIIRANEGGSRALGRLYGVNAAGAAIGALVPLGLLPAFGWTAAVEAVAAVGCLVAASAAVLALSAQGQPATDDRRSGHPAVRPSAVTLIAYGSIGAAAIVLEIGWTRLYGMVLLRTEYVLAVILGVYLLGIGAGSLVARRLAVRRWLALMPVLAALAALMTLWLLPVVSSWSQARDFGSLTAALLAEGGVLAAVTLPATLALGAWLPLLAAAHGEDDSIGPLLYGVNSLGAAAGALIGGFVLIPGIGTPRTVIAGALILFIAGAAWSVPRKAWLFLPAVLLCAWPVADFPSTARLLGGRHESDRDLYRYEDAMAITHVVERADGQRVLLTDLQRMDASTEQAAVELQKDQARLPLLLHPRPESVLFLGLGTGISAAGSLPYPGLERTAVELSRGAIAAATTSFAPANDGIVPRMTVLWDDARRILRTTDRRYDVIIGDVFHPDLVGRSALLSLQQFERARSRLNPGGVFAQWLALNQFDVESLQVICRTFHLAFPNAVMFVDGFRVALIGFADDDPASSRIQAVLRAAAQRDAAATGYEGIWTWLGRYWGRVPDGSGSVQDEWRPRIEFRLPQARYGGELDLGRVLGWLLDHRPPVATAIGGLGLAAADAAALERAYIATDLAMRSWLANLQGDSAQSNRLIRFAYQANPNDRWVGFSLADGMLAAVGRAQDMGMTRSAALEKILDIRPDHAETLRALWRLERDAGDMQAAARYLRRLAAVSPLDRDAIEFKDLITPVATP